VRFVSQGFGRVLDRRRAPHVSQVVLPTRWLQQALHIALCAAQALTLQIHKWLASNALLEA